MRACAIQWEVTFWNPLQVWRARGSKLISQSLNFLYLLLVQDEVLRRIPEESTPKQRSRAPHVPKAPTTMTHRILEVLPLYTNSNEPQRCRTRDRIWDAEEVLFNAPNQGSLLPNDACALKKKGRLYSEPVHVWYSYMRG